jgi:beta-N-acetylhexosaminidase
MGASARTCRRHVIALTTAALVGLAGVAGGGVLTAASAAAQATDPAECVSAVLSGMSLDQQAGQLFMVGVSSTAPTSAQLALVGDRHLGGVVLMGHTAAGVTATRQVTDNLQAQANQQTTAGVSLFVAVDQEGGNVQVLSGPGFSGMPTALAQGQQDPGALRSLAATWGGQLRDAGVTLNLAPVLDTVPADLGKANQPIGYYDREYGYTPDVVQAHGTAFLQGMADARVQATAKHFPGLGRVRDNTDTTFGVTDDVTTRDDAYLQPFTAAAGSGVAAVMVSLARYTKIDAANRAVFSPTVLQDMLRGDLGYSGVIVSDSMAAAAVNDLAPADRALQFLTAGGTVVLDTNEADIPAMVDAVTARATQDANFRALVQADARTVLLTKWQAGLVSCPSASDPIALHYTAMGGTASPLGSSTGAEYRVAGGRARDYQQGSIIWSARTGAHAVWGAIGAHYRSLGGPAGLLGFPTTDETGTPDGTGRYNHFDGADGASIYWTPQTGAWSIHGAIRDRWSSLGWERSALMYPTTDETGTPDGIGRFNHFSGTGGSSIYWTPGTGAHEVLGAIRARWASLGWERSALGYPTSGEYDVTGGRRSDFQHGSIVWNRATNTTTVSYR